MKQDIVETIYDNALVSNNFVLAIAASKVLSENPMTEYEYNMIWQEYKLLDNRAF